MLNFKWHFQGPWMDTRVQADLLLHVVLSLSLREKHCKHWFEDTDVPSHLQCGLAYEQWGTHCVHILICTTDKHFFWGGEDVKPEVFQGIVTLNGLAGARYSNASARERSCGTSALKFLRHVWTGTLSRIWIITRSRFSGVYDMKPERVLPYMGMCGPKGILFKPFSL